IVTISSESNMTNCLVPKMYMRQRVLCSGYCLFMQLKTFDTLIFMRCHRHLFLLVYFFIIFVIPFRILSTCLL
ncbi:hypothetical protein L9F63_014487, partial [Diploptera punctata]